MSEEEEFEFRARLEAESKAAPAAPKRTPNEEFLHRLGVLGRGLATGAAAVPMAFGDFSHGLSNLGRMAVGAETDKGPTPSQNFQNLLTHAGVGQPENGLEQFIDLGASMASGGGLVGRVAQKMAPRHSPALPTLHPTEEILGHMRKLDAAPKTSKAGDALRDASQNVIRHSRFGRFLGDLDNISPATLALMSVAVGEPTGIAAAGALAAARAMHKKPIPMTTEQIEALTAPKRLLNGRLVSAANLAKAKQLPDDIPLSVIERQMGIGMAPSLFLQDTE